MQSVHTTAPSKPAGMQGGREREKINDLETENQQVYVNTVVRVSAVIISDAEQAFRRQRRSFHRYAMHKLCWWEVGEAAGEDKHLRG